MCTRNSLLKNFQPPPKRFDIRSDVKFQKIPKLQTSFYPRFRRIWSMRPGSIQMFRRFSTFYFSKSKNKKLRLFCFRKVVFWCFLLFLVRFGGVEIKWTIPWAGYHFFALDTPIMSSVRPKIGYIQLDTSNWIYPIGYIQLDISNWTYPIGI